MGISPQDFEKMRSRLGGSARPKPSAVPLSTSATPCSAAKSTHQIILGIDPSLRGTGFGIIRLGKPVPTLLDSGTIRCPATWERSRCLVLIAQTLRDAIKRHQPSVCIIESLFYAQNFQTALIMGEARGASLVDAAEAGLEIFEMAPRKVKQAIVGYGAAQKSAVAKMVQRMLRLAEPPAPDAADALALALTFIQETGRYSLNNPRKV
ncbi:MAG: crossover junction endodeoxyribonuclease RuvC [Verrucomicrobiota bacterium]